MTTPQGMLAADIVREAREIYENHKDDDSAWVAAEQAYVRLISAALSRQAQGREALEAIKKICAGDRIPNWKDDWQTTHSRGRILDICDRALALTPAGAGREVSDEQIEEAIKKFARERGNAIQRLTFDKGPYEITEATRDAIDFARAILALAQAQVDSGRGRDD